LTGIKLSGAVWAKYLSLLIFPQQVFDYARASTPLALEIGKLLALQDDNHTFLKGQPQGVEHASWSAPLATATLAAIARHHGTTPNALVLAASPAPSTRSSGRTPRRQASSCAH
jgi:hypothetical protein